LPPSEQNPEHSDINELALRLNAVIETAIDGIITISERGIMENVNVAAARLFGYTKEEMVGQNVHMLMPQPDKGQHDQYIRNYLNTGKAKIIGIGREVTGLKSDGTKFPIRLSISEVKLADRRLFTGIVHDLTREKADKARILELNQQLERRVDQRTAELEEAITKLLQFNRKLEMEVKTRKAAEAELHQSKEEIRKALQAEKELGELKSRFVSMASHEFRTPLASILSSAELIEAYGKAEPHAKRDKHIKRVKTAVKTLTSILNDFLSLSKLEEGKVALQPTTFSFHEFCHALLDELAPTLREGQTIDQKLPAEELFVTLDKKALKIIFTNLLSNASKYSKESTTIHCHVELVEDQLSIEVRDEGIGIPSEDQGHLFSRFFRAHNVENIKGTGLGLNIVKQYVDLFGGVISFESIEGKGTTFRVTLPMTIDQTGI
jgi:two-component system sensor kinase FixL